MQAKTYSPEQPEIGHDPPHGFPLLAAIHLSTNYGKVEILKDINVEIWPKEVVCLIGANGAGKTTFIRAVSGLAPVVGGQMLFSGQDLRKLAAFQIARLKIGHVPQGRQIIPDLTVKGNLEMGSFQFYRSQHKKVLELMEREFDRFPILRERRNQIATSLSGGEQQMLALSRALMMDPIFLMMDEPSLGLAPFIVEEIFKSIWQLHESGITILLVEQNATLALAIAHRGYVLQNGKVFVHGTNEELLNNPDVIKGYLGRGDMQ
jgi:branched-chain amino acid transport system ATP-binding protein